MEVVKLGEGEEDETEENGPGLPSIELVDSVNDCAY